MASDPREVLTRPAPSPDRVLRYGAGPDQVVDLYQPVDDSQPAPLIVLLHGGFWRDAHDRTHVRPLADALRKEGFAVANPEYRRTPAAGWPQVRDDIVAVRDALPSLLPAQVAAEPYLLLGHSAGGHLALWWGLGAPDRVARVVALAPVADLARAYADDLDHGAVGTLMGGGPDEQPADYADADVARRLPAAAPATVVIHGGRDQRVPVDHSRTVFGAALRELPGIEHFGLIDPLSPAWPAVRDALR